MRSALPSSFLSGAVLLGLAAFSLPAQTQLRRIDAPSGVRRWGLDTVTLGDVNGDGVDDFAVGSDFDPAANTSAGEKAIRVYSGANSQQLYVVSVAPPARTPFQPGNVLAATGDVNGDGIPDFAHGAPRAIVGGNGNGAVFVRSGADGGVLRVVSAGRDSRFGSFGESVSGYSDVTGDGLPEILIGAPASTNAGRPVGAVTIYSPANDTIVRTIFQTIDGLFGEYVARGGDVDGDGAEEIAVQWLPTGQDRRIALLSGATGAVLWERAERAQFTNVGPLDGDFNGDGVDDLYATAFRRARVLDGVTGVDISFIPLGATTNSRMINVGDQDGGGRDDFLLSDLISLSGGTTCALYSGETGNVLLRLSSRNTSSDAFGTPISRIGDLNGDGRDDFLIATVGNGIENVSVYGWDGATSALALAIDIGDECRGNTSFLSSFQATPPVLGGTTTFSLLNAPSSAPVALLLGPPASLDLAPFGAPDCLLQVRLPSDAFNGATDSRGRFSIANVPIPAQSSLEGVVLNAQAVIFAPGVNPAGLLVSEADQLQIGR